MKKIKRIGVLTGGGDCPGLNAVIRAIVKTAAFEYDFEVVGFKDGFKGLVENRTVNLDLDSVSGILTQGGTILGTTNRADPFHYPILENGKYIFLDQSDQAVKTFEELGLDALICIGGDGTMAVSEKFIDKGIPIVGVPKTIDNDIWGTDLTFGFDSAMTTAAEAIDKIHTTAQAHHRVMIVEVMGRYAGWLALGAGIAGGGDIILIPEIPFDYDKICEKINERKYMGKNFSILVVGEGAKPVGGELVVRRKIEGSPEPIRLGGISYKISEEIESRISMETRVTILGHLQRGGIPTPTDRLLASRFGVAAVNLVAKKKFGKMVALKGNEIKSVAISEVAGKNRTVPLDSPLIQTARSLGSSLGDR